jgi:hypothetical protein
VKAKISRKIRKRVNWVVKTVKLSQRTVRSKYFEFNRVTAKLFGEQSPTACGSLFFRPERVLRQKDMTMKGPTTLSKVSFKLANVVSTFKGVGRRRLTQEGPVVRTSANRPIGCACDVALVECLIAGVV